MIQENVSNVLDAIRPFAPEPAFALTLEQTAYVGGAFSSFPDGDPLEDFTPRLSAFGKQNALSAHLRDGVGRFPETKSRSFPEILDELARNKAPFATVVDKQLVIYGMLLLEGEEISALEEGNDEGSFCSVRRASVFSEKFQSFSRWSQRSLPELPYFYPEALKMVELRFQKGAVLFEPRRRSSLPSWLSAFHPGYLFPHVREHQLQADRQRETGAGRFRIPFAHADVSTENFLLRLSFEDGTERCFGPQECASVEASGMKFVICDKRIRSGIYMEPCREPPPRSDSDAVDVFLSRCSGLRKEIGVSLENYQELLLRSTIPTLGDVKALVEALPLARRCGIALVDEPRLRRCTAPVEVPESCFGFVRKKTEHVTHIVELKLDHIASGTMFRDPSVEWEANRYVLEYLDSLMPFWLKISGEADDAC